jgi:hypothetical protein
MTLFLSALLALLPLLGIVAIVLNGSITTVDGLFGSLILLAMSGIVGVNVLLEVRKRVTGATKQSSSATVSTVTGRLTQRGKVESVLFYESGVGEPNKSVVSLGDGTNSSRLLILEGDMRNALPVGQRVEVTFRKESGHNVLVNVDYP